MTRFCVLSLSWFCLFLLQAALCKVNISIGVDDFSSSSYTYNWYSSQTWSWGIVTSQYPANQQDINRIITRDNMIIMVQAHANVETNQRNHGGTDPPAMNVIDLYLNSTPNEYKNQIKWQAFIEDDSSGVGFPYNLLLTTYNTESLYSRSYSISYEKWKQYLLETQQYIQLVNQQNNYNYNLYIYTQSGFTSSSHSYMSPLLGNSDCVLIERANDDIDDLQTGIAFNRGAAKQYNKSWGIDLSLWWGVISGCIQNLTSQSYHKRHLYISYLSGAQIINTESCNLFDENGNPSTLVSTLEQFGNFTVLYPDMEQYNIDIPISILLSSDNGYISPMYWSSTMFNWNYAKITPRIGDNSIAAFFNKAFPASNYYEDPFPVGKFENNNPPASSFALSSISAEYCPDGNTGEFEYAAESYIPFGQYYDRKQAQQAFNEEYIDPSPYRTMGDSRWGDIFDVFVLDEFLIKNNILSNYPMLLLLGAMNISNGSYLNMIQNYVYNGGILVWSIGIAQPQHSSLIGMNITGNILTGRYWQFMNESVVNEAFRYVPVNMNGNMIMNTNNVSILAKIPNSNRPLILKHIIGNGVVYTSLIPWFTGSLSYNLADLSLKLFDYVIAENDLQKVIIDKQHSSFGSLQFLSSYQKNNDNRNVLISNNDENEWNGYLLIKNVNVNYKTCKELLTDKQLIFTRLTENMQTINISLNIPKYDLRIIQCK